MTDKLIVEPTSTAQWHSLLKEVQGEYSLNLSEESESYLVFLLMRFTHNVEIVGSIFAIDYLQSYQKLGIKKQESLRDVGDKCLLFSGLFPENARRRQVKISYFVKLGQSAYEALSQLNADQAQWANLFDALAHDFVSLMEVLQATRNIAQHELNLDLLQMEELWSETGSLLSLNQLKQHCKAKDKLFTLLTSEEDNKNYH